MEETCFKFRDYTWDNVKMINYKPAGSGALTFSNVTRQNIVEAGGDIGFDMRYFECGIDGFTTLEKHEHVHVVMVLRGHGKILVGEEIHDVRPFDVVIIPSLAAHQLITVGQEPFGFVCTVNGTRDKFRLLSADELSAVRQNKAVNAFVRVPDDYLQQ